MKKYIIAFYEFHHVEDPKPLQKVLLQFCENNKILGTILLAKEGINGTISCDNEAVADEFKNLVKSLFPNILKNTGFKLSYHDKHPFSKLKVKIKKEIVAMGLDNLKIDETHKGTYVDPLEWDNLIQRSDVVLIDCRNNYESQVGIFKSSVKPDTISFREFPSWVEENKDLLDDKVIAMYCTGGIRCEKTTSLMKQLGYKDVYHLKGGILQYFEDTKNKNEMFEGSCFVFDTRVSLGGNLDVNSVNCPACDKILSSEEIKFDFGHRRMVSCISCVSNA